MSKDKIAQEYDRIWDWKINSETNKFVAPTITHPLPDFVILRLKWLHEEVEQNPALSFKGMLSMMLDVEDERKLKHDWELGALSEYLPISKEYKDWITDPFFHNVRAMSITVALIYGTK